MTCIDAIKNQSSIVDHLIVPSFLSLQCADQIKVEDKEGTTRPLKNFERMTQTMSLHEGCGKAISFEVRIIAYLQLIATIFLLIRLRYSLVI